MMSFDLALIAIFCYLSGSIPFGLLLTKFYGLGDIRSIGSGNIGATNVLRTGNKKLAAFTLLADFLKAFIPLLILKKMGFEEEPLFIFASFCLMGHVFPVWLKFKGGKGVAIALGAIMALDPMLALISLVIWLLAVKVTKISALGALTAFASAPLTAYFLSSLPCFTFTIVLCPFIFWTHRENILRLIKSDEHNF